MKAHESDGMVATAREIRTHGCAVVLSAPFTEQIRNAVEWERFVDALGGPPLHLLWVRSDVATLRARLGRRQSSRDAAKVADFDEFVLRMQPDVPPPVPHIAVDNRDSAPTDLETQLRSVAEAHHKHGCDPIDRREPEP